MLFTKHQDSSNKPSAQQHPNKPAHTQDYVAPFTYQCVHPLLRLWVYNAYIITSLMEHYQASSIRSTT
eukprot:8801257-Ditylum_brightwellii.AAC.1